MCKSCDSSFSNLESSFRYRFMRWFEHPFPHESLLIPLPSHVYYSYADAKLFALLTVWRMSISTQPFFREVKLPSAVQDDIRLRLLNRNPGAWNQYPFSVELESSGLFKGMMTAPQAIEVHEQNSFIFRWFVAGAWVTGVFPLEGQGVHARWSDVQGEALRRLPSFLKESGRMTFLKKPITEDPIFSPLWTREMSDKMRAIHLKQERARASNGRLKGIR